MTSSSTDEDMAASDKETLPTVAISAKKLENRRDCCASLAVVAVRAAGAGCYLRGCRHFDKTLRE